MSVAELPNRSPEFERVPPHDVVAEQGVLGGMMLSKDAIADVVSTGNTLRQAGLKVIGESMLESEAVLISSSKTSNEMQVLIHRLNSVIIARQYVLMDYDIKKSDIDAACAITPGLESPTISPLQNPDWLAVRAMVLRTETNRVMDDLYVLGARGILVTDIHACRL